MILKDVWGKKTGSTFQQFAVHDDSACGKPRSSSQALADRVDIVELARFELEHRSIARRARLQGSEIAAAQSFRRRFRRRPHGVRERKAEAKKLRHRREQIERRPIDAERMHVARYAVGGKAV